MCVSIVDEPSWLKAKLDGKADTHTSTMSIADVIWIHVLPVQHKAKQASKQASKQRNQAKTVGPSTKLQAQGNLVINESNAILAHSMVLQHIRFKSL